MDMPLSRKLVVAFSIMGSTLPRASDANEVSSLSPLRADEARSICASIDDASIPSEKYVHACMAFYLGYMRGVPAPMTEPFREDLMALGIAQAALDKGLMQYGDYFKMVSERTCRIAEEFRSRPLMDWALGEIVVGVAEMIQGQAAGNKTARIPMGAGETLKACNKLALTS